MTPLYTTLHRRPSTGAALGAALLVTAVQLFATAGCSSHEPVRPNVLLVVISGVRADHASSYGYGKTTTPSLDALAKDGTLFENAFTPAPWCPSAEASIATGLYMAEHGVTFDHPVLDASFETLAERLKATGYATFAVSTDPTVGSGNGFGQGVDSFVEINPQEESSPDEGAASAEMALTKWLDSRKSQAPGGPFFASVLLTNPRLPFDPPGEYRDKFLDRPVPLPRLEQLTHFWLPFARQFTMGATSLTPEEMAAMTALYDGEIAYADYRLGRIIEALKAGKLLDETLVVVTSDSGEDLGDHGLLADVSRVYDSIVRVPLVMRLPGRVPAGQRVAEQVQTLDIGRTILAVAGPSAVPGQAPVASVAPLMERRPVAIIEARFDPGALRQYRSMAPGGDVSIYELNMVAVRTPQYKYIITSKNTGALFDLKSDPGEHKSVLADHAAQRLELESKLAAWAALLKRPSGAAEPAARQAAPPGSTPPGKPAPAQGTPPAR